MRRLQPQYSVANGFSASEDSAILRLRSGWRPELLSKDANRRMETPGFSPESFIFVDTQTGMISNLLRLQRSATKGFVAIAMEPFSFYNTCMHIVYILKLIKIHLKPM